jgi:hypothetical protein
MALGIGLTGAIFNTLLGPSGGADRAILVHAFDVSMVFASGVAVLAAGVSFSRGNDRPLRLDQA